jgi:tetraacyldisaccharide 4'-kinase
VSVTTSAVQPLAWFKGKTALLCSAVGHAGSFRSLVERMGIRILGEVAYVDHHAYTRQDVERLRARAVELQTDLVVTTEKDACKMASLLHPTDSWWAVRLTTHVIKGEDRLRQLVLGMGHRLKAESEG